MHPQRRFQNILLDPQNILAALFYSHIEIFNCLQHKKRYDFRSAKIMQKLREKYMGCKMKQTLCLYTYLENLELCNASVKRNGIKVK